MARKKDLKDILFPVELHPIYADIPINDLSNVKKTKKVLIPTSQAVVNMASGNTLGIVSRVYKLITNHEAVDLGKKCCQELLGLENTDLLEIFNVYAPSTMSYCHVDLVHKGYEMNLGVGAGKVDVFLPYVRVTNSYNTTRALRFDIGFCRKLCLNGVIFEAETISFAYSHVKHEISQPIQFAIKKDKLEKLKADFREAIQVLRNMVVKQDHGRQLFSIIFGVPDVIRTDLKDDDRQELDSFYKYIEHLFNKYYEEMGDNAYSLFNIITDMASNPPDNRFFRRDVITMQKMAGAWINDLKIRIKTSPIEFQWDKYVEDLRQKYQRSSDKNPYN